MIRLVRTIAEQNMARFYLIQVVPGLFGNWGLMREWGRIGHRGSVRLEWYSDEETARNASEIILESKLERGYRYVPGSEDYA
jgi:predicted DNA-binding WGR domain protein